MVTIHLSEVYNVIDKAVFEVADTAYLLWKHMDDAYIVYDQRSGHSQVMNDFAREIFAIMEEKPCHLGDIMTELHKILDHSLDDELQQKIRQTIIEFDKMGLIMPMKSETIKI